MFGNPFFGQQAMNAQTSQDSGLDSGLDIVQDSASVPILPPPDCPMEDLNSLVGVGNVNKNLKMQVSLPGSRCFNDDLLDVGNCVPPTCDAVKKCKEGFGSIIGKCRVTFASEPQMLCCLQQK